MATKAAGERSGRTMKTIDKALNLLDFFLPETPEWRLSDLARASRMDKVTTMRVLNSLAARGFVEKHPDTRTYRLGAAVLRLAKVREACFPLTGILQPVVGRLAVETGETTHATIFSGATMTTVAVAEPERATRVHVNPAQPLPIHATASGLAYLAFAADGVLDGFLSGGRFDACTADTPTDRRQIADCVAQAVRDGFAMGDRTFEDDVTGMAAPVFDWHGSVCATVAAACLSTRLTDETRAQIADAVRAAAAEATRAMGGEVPARAAARRSAQE